ncbi:MAG: ACT domain-containing protein, partial [Spirochaetales bacterium]|nr:ACT domain-containing protein [Spirochaetales bacterium]
MEVRQISVFLENRSGQLAHICRIIADAGINMKALNIAETSDYGIVRLIT